MKKKNVHPLDHRDRAMMNRWAPRTAHEVADRHRRVQLYEDRLTELFNNRPSGWSHPFAYFRMRTLFTLERSGIPWIGPMDSGGGWYHRNGISIGVSLSGQFQWRDE